MGSNNAVWGIDIGQCALKALKLRPAEDGQVEVVAFDVIEHPKILSQPDADRDELISSALEKFASRNDWQGDRFVVGVPGQQTFARFCKMPPIDLKKGSKKIHELVRYEASQQIPFDMEDVVWDYQVFASPATPDIEVGIFAIRKDLIRKHLGYFSSVSIAPSGVQAIPAALYNFCSFDRPGDKPKSEDAEEGSVGATVIIDVGSQNTDLIIVEPNSAWTRNIPLGGNSFTEALVRAFKLSFAKAESLKRSAASSKYARQIFQAMRPVFAELVAEIQRSIGFYSSTRRDVELREVLALGNAFRLPGLQKYLENNLTVAGGVKKLEKFDKLAVTATVNAPQFTENILSFGAAYGLALQGLGLAKIHASLLPPEMARIAVWRKKRPYFVATAASLLLAAGIPWVANALDMQKLESERNVSARNRTAGIINRARDLNAKYGQVATGTEQRDQDIQKLLQLQDKKYILPRLVTLIHEALPPTNPPELATVTSGEALRALIESDPARFKRSERGQLIIEGLEIEYEKDVDNASLAAKEGGGSSAGPRPGGQLVLSGSHSGYGRPREQSIGESDAGGQGQPGFVVRVTGRLLYSTIRSSAVQWFQGKYFARLRELSRQSGLGFYIPDFDPADAKKRQAFSVNITNQTPVSLGATGAANQTGTVRPEMKDPVTGEDTRNDWNFSFAFRVRLGEVPPEAPAGAEQTTP